MGSGSVIKNSKGRAGTAEQCSALVLSYLKASAEEALGETITGAVISVPAYFSESQKSATKLSAVWRNFR